MVDGVVKCLASLTSLGLGYFAALVRQDMLVTGNCELGEATTSPL